MEYVEGESLQARLGRGPLPLKETLKLGAELAEALESAHGKGIIHRDLKPANVMITPSGHPKIMDFGLAKKVVSENGREQDISSALTREGSTLGTPAYMSPEQIRAQPVDHRSDIFSFGIVLYETLTGVHPFRKSTQSETTGAILHEEPHLLATYLNDVPDLLQHTLHKMLAKNPDQRYQTVHEIWTNLEEVRENSGPQPLDAQRDAYRGRLGIRLGLGIAVVVLGIGVIAFFLGWIPWAGSNQLTASTFRAVPVTSLPGGEWRPDFSLGGDRIAFQWAGPDAANPNSDIWVKQLRGGEPLRLTFDPAIDRYSRWSPDGQEIAFARWLPGKIAIKTVPSLGGHERLLVEVARNQRYDHGLTGISWAPDGRTLAISYRPGGQLEARVFLLSIDTAEIRPFSSPPAGSYGDYFAQFSPDGRTIAFFRQQGYADWDLFLQSLEATAPEQVTSETFRNAAGLAWMPNGRGIVFSASGAGPVSLWRVAVPGNRPIPLTDQGAYLRRTFPAFSPRGDRLAYTEVEPGKAAIWQFVNPRVNESSIQPHSLIASSRWDGRAVPSPDGKRLLFESNRTGPSEIFISEVDGSQQRQITFLNADTGSPMWSPDGRRICFDARTGGVGDIFVVGDQGGAVRQLTTDPAEDVSPSWSSNGHWIYFASNRTGRHETWKVPSAGGEAVQVTRNGGYYAQESSDGFLHYTKAIEGSIWKLPLTGGEETLVLDRTVRWEDWVLTPEGIYYVTRKQEGTDWIWDFRFLTHPDRVDQEVFTWRSSHSGDWLAVSPDQKWFFPTVFEPYRGSDIMLVENFR